MNPIKFWITINGRLSDSEATKFWHRIRHNHEINLMIMESEMYIYGETAKYVLEDVIYQCVMLGYPLQLKN